MTDSKPTYQELQKRLAVAESFIEAFQHNEVDSIISKEGAIFVQLKKTRNDLEESRKELRFVQSALDSLSASIVILDESGLIIAVNAAWKDSNNLSGFIGAGSRVGDNYSNLCRQAYEKEEKTAGVLRQGICDVFKKSKVSFFMEYASNISSNISPARKWFEVRVNRFDEDGPARVVVAHEDITEMKKAVEVVKLNEARLSTLWELSQMTEASIKQIADFCLESSIKLTQSSIGFLNFLNEDETIATMHAWSKSVMKECSISDKPGKFIISQAGVWADAVRNRKPVIINEYHKTNQNLRGLPKGHVDIKRFMCIPVFEADRIVAVAGVGNKLEKYDESDVRQLRLLTDGMWQIIIKKEMDKSLKLTNEELEKRVEERTAEQKRLQNDLIRSERMAASGQLAASIAHEINSPLQGIVSIINVMEKDCSKDQLMLENLEMVKSGFERIKNTVKKLLDLNRPGKEDKQFININEVIESSVILMKSYLRKRKITIRLNLSKNIPEIFALSQQLSQVFMNLINNSIEAISNRIPEKENESMTYSSGIITIKTEFNEKEIVIQCCDTGPGISEKDKKHIFDPYYTRKKGMGMGIGLSICQSIIEKHNGRIFADNSSEGGAVFTIFLPVN